MKIVFFGTPDFAVPSLDKLNQKYQVVIPKNIRKRYRLRPKQKVVVSGDEQGIYIFTKPTQWSSYMKGLGKDYWKKSGGVKSLMKEREEWDDQ